ncbi:YgaP family membrane protein [Defluviimonas sp. SAOS-178_SWC]|uniref:YgaP family membrane protein n=1 Tax=Defluviimonas sp. SAOS-178_SWC TaxID=3121287 RepID=UPI003221F062
MFKTNVGGIDRVLRIVLGLALLAGFFLNADAAYRWAYLIGILPLVTGLMGSCPAYTILGLSTCPMKKS